MQDIDKPWYEVWPKCATPTLRVKQNLDASIKLDITKYRVKQLNPNLKLLGMYTKVGNPIHTLCTTCSYEWNPLLLHLLKGHGCPNCSGLLKITHEQFLDMLPEGLETLGIYSGMRTYLDFKCKLCSFIWTTIPRCIVHNGTGCPSCANQVYSVVYLLYLKEEDLYKIGITKDNQKVGKRAKQIHKDIQIVQYWDIRDKKARVLEKYLHSLFKEKQVNSLLANAGSAEFFKLDTLDLYKINKIIEDFNSDSI